MATVRAISSGAFAPLDLSRVSNHFVTKPQMKPIANPPATRAYHHQQKNKDKKMTKKKRRKKKTVHITYIA